MKLLTAILFAFILISIVFACTKEQLIAQIDAVTKALNEAAPKIKTIIDNYGSTMNDKMKKAVTKAHDDMIKFKKDKENIKKKVNSGAMSVDDGCAEASKLTQKFVNDMKNMESAIK